MSELMDWLLHEREYEWRKTTDACLASFTVGRARQVLRELEGQQAAIERLRAALTEIAALPPYSRALTAAQACVIARNAVIPPSPEGRENE